ncbi:hypothetical protein D3C72_227910 [compost metagenome]
MAQFDSHQTNYQTALEFYRLGEWTTAERILGEILSHASDHHQARWTLASLYVRTGRKEAATQLFTEIAKREGGDLAKHAKAWLEANPPVEVGPAFTPDASGSVSLAGAEAGYQLATFPTAPLSLQIPEGYKLQTSEVKRQGSQWHARYLFAPDAKAAKRLGLAVEVVTLTEPEPASNHRVVMVREMLSRDGLNRNTPFREQDQLVHGHLARYLGYSDPVEPRVQVLALGVATDRYRVILRAACHESILKQHLPKQQGALGSLRLR